MFKMSFAVFRRPELTQEQFLDYWQTVHAPLLIKHMAALRVRKYVQLHGKDCEVTRMLTESRHCMPPHDGVCEIWWDSEEDRLAASKSPEGMIAGQELKEDELRFCDLSRSTVTFGYEHVIVDNGVAQ